MESLLDEVLVVVLQYVDVPDLLSCRLVCKRLGELALHQDVWRHRRMSLMPDEWLAPALRLAPCVENALFELSAFGSHSLYTETECAVKSLAVYVAGAGGEEMLETAMHVIQNQLALGRLRGLTLLMEFNGSVDLEPLLHLLVYGRCGLEELQIPVVSGISGWWDPEPEDEVSLPESSLKRFRCVPHPMTRNFFNYMLKVHAPTLEALDFHLWPWSRHWGPLLLRMPNLRELVVDPYPGMAALATCATLRRVILHAHARVKDAEEFLRRAHQLQSVSLRYTSTEGQAVDDGGCMGLVLALAGRPGQSRLETLEIDDDRSDASRCSYLRPLLAALPSLPALRHLEVNAVVELLAGALTPAKAPALRTLRLNPVGLQLSKGIECVCVHARLHERSVFTLMADNPLVEVHMDAPRYCQAAPCKACARGCHQDILRAPPPHEEPHPEWGAIYSWVKMNQFKNLSKDFPPQ
ncbi:uncharacterized protein LOC113205987 [Frankliniella occidentalis]|uniref:Uncharacterized protein LOC113205987 n=1 Tax=Frankliniella occidentalis TaxID=133901 RepID=A0A6J1SGB3_FRAOC|nr:uncharacterized protein LOC113205987 [Frankliniella occidentalis]